MAVSQVAMMYAYKKNSTPDMAARYLDMMQTYWSSPTRFIEEQKKSTENKENSAECFNAMVNVMNARSKGN